MASAGWGIAAQVLSGVALGALTALNPVAGAVFSGLIGYGTNLGRAPKDGVSTRVGWIASNGGTSDNGTWPRTISSLPNVWPYNISSEKARFALATWGWTFHGVLRGTLANMEVLGDLGVLTALKRKHNTVAAYVYVLRDKMRAADLVTFCKWIDGFIDFEGRSLSAGGTVTSTGFGNSFFFSSVARKAYGTTIKSNDVRAEHLEWCCRNLGLSNYGPISYGGISMNRVTHTSALGLAASRRLGNHGFKAYGDGVITFVNATRFMVITWPRTGARQWARWVLKRAGSNVTLPQWAAMVREIMRLARAIGTNRNKLLPAMRKWLNSIGEIDGITDSMILGWITDFILGTQVEPVMRQIIMDELLTEMQDHGVRIHPEMWQMIQRIGDDRHADWFIDIVGHVWMDYKDGLGVHRVYMMERSGPFADDVVAYDSSTAPFPPDF